jgi:hypothetical protein
MSYAPESIGTDAVKRARSAEVPEWTLCRNLNVVSIPDSAILRRWTAEGRVRPDDYLVNHQLDLCVQAKEIAELDAMFRKDSARLSGRICAGLLCAASLLAWPIPLFGGVLLIGAIVAAVLFRRASCCPQTYRLYAYKGDGALSPGAA